METAVIKSIKNMIEKLAEEERNHATDELHLMFAKTMALSMSLDPESYEDNAYMESTMAEKKSLLTLLKFAMPMDIGHICVEELSVHEILTILHEKINEDIKEQTARFNTAKLIIAMIEKMPEEEKSQALAEIDQMHINVLIKIRGKKNSKYPLMMEEMLPTQLLHKVDRIMRRADSAKFSKCFPPNNVIERLLKEVGNIATYESPGICVDIFRKYIPKRRTDADKNAKSLTFAQIVKRMKDKIKEMPKDERTQALTEIDQLYRRYWEMGLFFPNVKTKKSMIDRSVAESTLTRKIKDILIDFAHAIRIGGYPRENIIARLYDEVIRETVGTN